MAVGTHPLPPSPTSTPTTRTHRLSPPAAWALSFLFFMLFSLLLSHQFSTSLLVTSGSSGDMSNSRRRRDVVPMPKDHGETDRQFQDLLILWLMMRLLVLALPAVTISRWVQRWRGVGSGSGGGGGGRVGVVAEVEMAEEGRGGGVSLIR